MIDKYIYVIVALLPLSALMLVTQVNPYSALVMRAILGAIAALVYAILGAADVALTEAMVGTLLAVTLYVVAVRSSLIMRLGILEAEVEIEQKDTYLAELISSIKKIVNQYYLRLEIVKYPNLQALEQGLKNQEVHAICSTQQLVANSALKSHTAIETKQTYHTAIRVHRLFEIIQSELTFPETTLTYLSLAEEQEKYS
jgi:putative multicomponent Na+:H+ antiporter subunit B